MPRPGSVTAAAVMAIVYGSLFGLCGLCTGVAALVGPANPFAGDPQQQQVQKQIEDAMERELPANKAIGYVSLGVTIVLPLTILCGGLGLLSMYSWARLLTLGATGLALLFALFQTIYQAVFVFPVMQQAIHDVLPNMVAQGGGAVPVAQLQQIIEWSMMFGIVAGIVIQFAVFVYLAVIMILLMRPSVRAAFAGGGAGDFHMDSPSRDRDDMDDEPWRPSEPRPKPQDDWRIQ